MWYRFRFSIFGGVKIIVFATALICLDAFRFESILGETRSALSEMNPEGMGSIGGWPLGLEMHITLKRLPTDKELHHLASAASQTNRIYIGLHLDCEVSEKRLREIREVLSECNASVIALPVATDETPLAEQPLGNSI